MIKAIVLHVISAFLCGHVICQLRWQRLLGCNTPSSPSPRRGVVIGYDVTRNQLVIFGGRPGPKHDTWIFNVTLGTWKEVVSPIHPPARYGAVGGVSGDYFYIATGEGDNAEYLNDIWRFDLQSETWKELPAQQRPSYISIASWTNLTKTSYRPGKRHGAAGGIYPGGGALFLSQGFSDVRYFCTFTYDVNNMKWYKEFGRGNHPYNPTYPHARRYHAGAVISDDELVIFGGCLTGGRTGGPCPSGDSWLYDRRRRYWRKLESCPAPRLHASMAALPEVTGLRRVLLYGGIEDSSQVLRLGTIEKDTVAVLNPETGYWTERKTVAIDDVVSTPGKRSSAGMATGKDGVFLFGGLAVDRNVLQCDVWLLRGDALSADNTPEVTCSSHSINLLTIHGTMMVIGWAVFLQWGAFIARYLKSDTGLWLNCHIAFQVCGICCCIVGLVFGIMSVQFNHFVITHSILGLVAMLLLILQPINAIIRPPKSTTFSDVKSTSRRLWEWVHFFGGRCSLLISFAMISIGVFLAVTPTLIWSLWFGYLGLVVTAYILVELYRSVRGRKKDVLSGRLRYHPSGTTNYVLSEPGPKEPPVDYDDEGASRF